MRFNMKNFPLKVNQTGIDITLITTPKLSKDDKKIIAIAEWKVGFEKELRELDNILVFDATRKLVKEILGDA